LGWYFEAFFNHNGSEADIAGGKLADWNGLHGKNREFENFIIFTQALEIRGRQSAKLLRSLRFLL
jgi:hypothetical protein